MSLLEGPATDRLIGHSVLSMTTGLANNERPDIGLSLGPRGNTRRTHDISPGSPPSRARASDGALDGRRKSAGMLNRLRSNLRRSWHDRVVVVDGEERTSGNVWTDGVAPIAPTTRRM